MQRLFISLLATAIVTTVVVTPSYSQQDELKENVKTFMQAKLLHAQKVLEGLAIEDFDRIARSSQEISLLSQAAQWQVLQTPDYVRRSAEFRREVDGLTKAARDKNLDGATLAYVKVTMNCIECHKYVRSVREARLEPAEKVSPSIAATSLRIRHELQDRGNDRGNAAER